MNKLYRGPSIDASDQVSVHLAKVFQRRFKKIVQSETELPVAAMFVNGSGRNEQTL
jgi:excinuclease UvrABC nuclease subunit